MEFSNLQEYEHNEIKDRKCRAVQWRNSNQTDELLGVLSNLKDENSNERCDLASERYVVEAAIELRKYEHPGYQLFQTSFNQLIERNPCSTYKTYKKNVQDISPQCRGLSLLLNNLTA
ncbi:hypothetical protein LOAG_01128 [Loa loa]|uniref:Uncharacterized protein n=1 Tax=Loa loa TaxID=7209 RepID=A0A1S0U9L4_LOALO|nr:hypothetical protein LOAG_01128 [Loa loa]EFO27358.1 hypothetical protein LOAG_01128 [Loa loa]